MALPPAMKRAPGADGSVQRLLLPILLALLQVRHGRCQGGSCTNLAASLAQCEQVVTIAKATGQTECEYRRGFYTCMLAEGCYYLEAACLDGDRAPVSCSELCEAEPLFSSCVEPRNLAPPEDYHLCPHIPKAFVTALPPTLQDFLASPALPYTLTVWTTFRAGSSADPASLVPAVLPVALGVALGRLLGLNPLAIVVVDLPISHSKGALALPRAELPPVWTQHTSFMSFNIHIRNLSDVDRMDGLSQLVLMGGSGNDAEVRSQLKKTEQELENALNASIPSGSNLRISQLQISARQGLTSDFPEIAETTPVPSTTAPIDLSLQIQRWRAWRVRCLDGIVYRWEVSELELWADRCPDVGGTVRLVPGLFYYPISSRGFNGSGYSMENAFDAEDSWTRTTWISDCTGCAPGTVWLGLDSGDAGAFRVACVTVKQGLSATNQCGRIGVEASDNLIDWEVRGEMVGLGEEQSLCVLRTAQDFPMLQCGVLDDGCRGQIQFGDCPGYAEICESNLCVCTGRLEVTDPKFDGWECGTTDDGCGGSLSFGNCSNATNASCYDNYCKEDVSAAAHWRLVCMGETVGRWVVRELEFHIDGLCTIHYDVFKSVASSGSHYSDLPASNAFDGNVQTPWVSQCRHCRPSESWLSLNFNEKIIIRCVRLVQDPRTTEQCPRMQLEYSDDGIYWKLRSQYGFNGLTVGEDTKLQAGMDNMNAEDVDIEERFAYYWRVTCMKEMDVQWGIYEFDFFDDKECRNSLRSAAGEVIHSRSATWPADNSYDQNHFTIWMSKCGQCGATEDRAQCTCKPGEAYIGLRFVRPVLVRCITVLQLEAGSGLCSDMGVHLSDNPDEPNSWKTRDLFDGLGYDMRLVMTPPKNAPEEVANQATRAFGSLALLLAATAAWLSHADLRGWSMAELLQG